MCQLGIAISAFPPVISVNLAVAAWRIQVGVVFAGEEQSREVSETKVMFVQRRTFLLYLQVCSSGEAACDCFQKK